MEIKKSIFAVPFLLLACCARTEAGNDDKGRTGTAGEWSLVWEDEFDGPSVDDAVWSRIPRGTSSWQDTQSSDDRCYEMREGCLVLKGIVNDDLEKDPSPYLTGGIWSQDKKAFGPGRIEVRARLQAAQGAWPAIWLLPFDTLGKANMWPDGGEIDIMERLNYDSIAYQTVHSHYTFDLGRGDSPRQGNTAPIDPDDFNVYGVDIWRDSVVFHINGVRNFAYPRIAELDSLGQFPFYKPMYLLVDMQLGGQWVGKVDPADLPVEMEVDWVRYYEWK